MKFEEIFKEEGLYKSEGFIKGYCYEVDADGYLYSLQYKNKDDITPNRERAFIYKGVFEKNFIKIYTRQSLFN